MRANHPAVAVLLGAGASADAGIPMTMEMTDAVISRMDDASHKRILEFVKHTLAADLAQRQTSTYEHLDDVAVGVDIERLFASVDLLVDRDIQPWRPFVASWHYGLEGFGGSPSLRSWDISWDLDKVVGEVIRMLPDGSATRRSPGIYGSHDLKNALGSLLEKAFRLALPRDVTSLLKEVRTAMLQSLFELLRISDPARVEYLKPLIEFAREQRSMTVATLNYDRSVENAAEAAGLAYDTAIEKWLSRGALEWQDEGLQLLKLHGSIDWVFEHDRGGPGQLPRQQILTVTEDEKARYEAPAVVFGEAGKLRSEGPFLELLLAWAEALRKAKTLLVIGYSFRDDHVNEFIARWLQAEATRRLVVLDPNPLSSLPRGSFPWHLALIDQDTLGNEKPPEQRRVLQIHARTKDGLQEALEAAIQTHTPAA